MTSEFAYDDCVEGVPFADHVSGLDFVAVLEEQFRAVGDGRACECELGLGIDDAHFGETSEHDFDGLAVAADFGGCDGAEFLDLENAVIARYVRRYGGDVGCDTTDVECTECQLSTRFADRLCCDHADSLAFLHEAVVGEVAAVALGADAFLGLAGEH